MKPGVIKDVWQDKSHLNMNILVLTEIIEIKEHNNQSNSPAYYYSGLYRIVTLCFKIKGLARN